MADDYYHDQQESNHLTQKDRRCSSSSPGSLFDVKVKSNRIELVPLEVKREFSDEEYEKLERLYQRKNSAKKVTNKYIESIG